MSWLFGKALEKRAAYDRTLANDWLGHRNAYDKCLNNQVDKMVEFKRQNKGKPFTEQQKILLRGYEIEAVIHDRLAHVMGSRIGLE